MIVSLKNFKSWEDATFEISDKGITLISGNSGCGKTSVLQAIHFALYGKGTKVVRIGSTSCRVELDVGEMHIVRTKKPNRLVINNTYEDDVAQEIINKKFGKNFTIVSYVEQESFSSVVHMTPQSRLQFLETFAFDDVDICSVKEKLRVKVQDAESRVKVASSMYTSCVESVKGVNEPVECEKPLEEKKDLGDVVKTLGVLRNKRDDLDVLQKKYVDCQKSVEMLQNIEREIDDVERNISDVGFPGYDVVEKARTVVSLWKKSVEYSDLCKMCDEVLSSEMSEYTLKVDDLRKKVWNEETRTKNMNRLKYLREQSVENKKFLEITSRREELQKYEDEYVRVLPESGCSVTCPSCNVDLSLVGSTLYKAKVVPESKERLAQLQSYHDEYVRISMQNYKYVDINEELEMLENEASDQTHLERELSKVNVFRPSKYLESIISKRDSLVVCKVVTDEEYRESLDILKKHEGNYELYKHLMTKLTSLNMERDKIVPSKRYSDVSEEIREVTERILQYENEFVYVQDLNRKWSEYEVYKKEKKVYDESRERVDSCLKVLRDCEENLRKVYAIKQIVSQSESMCLESTISTINIHAQQFLDLFFPLHPMTARLTPYKEVKKGRDVTSKPQIDITIQYNGNDTELDSLSGGERARVSLAFTLALAEIHRSPLIMLDESISSLDHESTVNVLSAIKEVLTECTVLCVSHQATEGIFDNVITI